MSSNVFQVFALLASSLLVVIAVWLVVQIALCWVAAKLLARDQASLWNAARWYGYNLLTAIGTVLVTGLVMFIFAMLGVRGVGVLALVAVAALIYFAFTIPMQIFQVSAVRAFAMMVVVWVGGAAVSFGVNQFVATPVSQQELQASLSKLQAAELEKLAKQATAAAPTPAHDAPAVLAKAKPGKQVTITRPVRVPLKIDGKVKGDVELERGDKLDLVGNDGKRVFVKYLDDVVSVPRDATDL